MMKYKNLLLAVGSSAMILTSAQAASGIFGAYVGITPQGGSETVYGENQPGSNTVAAFGGANLGSINVGESLTISYGEVLTFKNDGSDVSGANVNYRVFETGSTPGAFNAISLNFGSDATFTDVAGNQFTNSGDQTWRSVSSSPDVASGLSEGDYRLEIFWDAATTDGGSFVNDGGSNFVADFSVVPEPSAFALIAGFAGLLFVMTRRRLNPA